MQSPRVARGFATSPGRNALPHRDASTVHALGGPSRSLAGEQQLQLCMSGKIDAWCM
jgi:hypothetical protein